MFCEFFKFTITIENVNPSLMKEGGYLFRRQNDARDF